VRPLIAATLLLAALGAVGCAPPDAEVRLARLDAERASLERTLDALEDRLLANQARVRLWKELRARHESVAAVACASLDEHADEMARREARRPDVRVAAASSEAPAASRGATQ
jgi:hypothetical protein